VIPRQVRRKSNRPLIAGGSIVRYVFAGIEFCTNAPRALDCSISKLGTYGVIAPISSGASAPTKPPASDSVNQDGSISKFAASTVDPPTADSSVEMSATPRVIGGPQNISKAEGCSLSKLAASIAIMSTNTGLSEQMEYLCVEVGTGSEGES
jgi:hypothetical protein